MIITKSVPQDQNGSLNQQVEPRKDQIVLDVLNNTAVTIYQNVAQFSDYFNASITSKETELVYFSPHIKTDNTRMFIHLDQADGMISSHKSCGQNFNVHNYLHSLIGQDLTMQIEDRQISGTLIGQDGNKWVLSCQHDGHFGLTYVDKNDIVFVTSKNLADKVATKPYIKAKYITEKSAEHIKGQVVFTSYSLGWAPVYRLVIEKSSDNTLKGKWVAQARISNKSQIELKDLMVKVVGGELNLVEGTPVPMPCFNEMRTACVAGVAKAAIDQQWQDLKAYLIPHKVSLKPSESICTDLYEPQDVQVSKTHSLHSYEYQDGEHSFNVCYQIDNTEENHLNLAYPKGNVEVYQKDGQHIDFIGKNALGHTPKGKDIEIVTGKSFDLSTTRTTHVENIRDFKGKIVAKEITVTHKLRNASDQGQSVFLHEHIHGHHTLIQSQKKPSFIENNEMVFKVDLPKTSSSDDLVEFSYKYRKELV